MSDHYKGVIIGYWRNEERCLKEYEELKNKITLSECQVAEKQKLVDDLERILEKCEYERFEAESENIVLKKQLKDTLAMKAGLVDSYRNTNKVYAMVALFSVILCISYVCFHE